MRLSMKSLAQWGAAASVYMAAAYAVGITLFLVVLDYPSMTDPAQRMALLLDRQMVIVASNLVLYVIFGLALIVLVAALRDRLKAAAPALSGIAAIVGVVWAGSLIASGMVANAGIGPAVALHATDPGLAAANWAQIEAIASGLGNGNGEILGGLMTGLFSWAGQRSRALPTTLNAFGLVVGAIGIASLVPGLSDLAGVFGLAQIPWFIGLAYVLVQRPAAG
jgi:hypothetical protein